MNKHIEVSARTIEDAVNEGLAKLGCAISDCKVDILQEGAKGLFGFFGSKPATVRLTLLDDEADDDLSINLQASLSKEPQAPVKAARPQQPQKERAPQAPPEKKPAPERKAAPEKNGDKNKMRIAANPQVIDKPKSSEVLERFKTAPLPGGRSQAEGPPHKSVAKPARPAQPQKRAPREEHERLEPAHAELVERTPIPAPENITLHDPGTLEGRSQQFLLELTRRMGVDVQVETRRREDGHLFATMYGDTLGILIGRRGETLDALQYLTSLQINRGQEEYTRITLDTENYRAKREEALTRLAARMANRAVKTGRKVSLEPMNPYERRILHASLQGNPNVTTHSEGDEPYRHVVVVPER